MIFMESSGVIFNKLKSGEFVSKGSYCQCHYCKCEKGYVSCKGYGHEGGGYGEYRRCPIFNYQFWLLGKG